MPPMYLRVGYIQGYMPPMYLRVGYTGLYVSHVPQGGVYWAVYASHVPQGGVYQAICLPTIPPRVYHPSLYASLLYHPGYTTPCTPLVTVLHSRCAVLGVQWRGSGLSLEVYLGYEAHRALLSPFLLWLLGGCAQGYSALPWIKDERLDRTRSFLPIFPYGWDMLRRVVPSPPAIRSLKNVGKTAPRWSPVSLLVLLPGPTAACSQHSWQLWNHAAKSDLRASVPNSPERW